MDRKKIISLAEKLSALYEWKKAHAKDVEELKTQVRDLEKFMWKAVGAIGLAAIAVSAMISFLGK